MTLGPVPDPDWRECMVQHRTRIGKTKQWMHEATGIERHVLYRIEAAKQAPTDEQRALIERYLLDAEWRAERDAIVSQRRKLAVAA